MKEICGRGGDASSFLLTPHLTLRPPSQGIEYHHIHHLNPQVPCYKLAECHESAPKGTWDNVVQVVGGSRRSKMVGKMYELWGNQVHLRCRSPRPCAPSPTGAFREAGRGLAAQRHVERRDAALRALPAVARGAGRHPQGEGGLRAVVCT